MRPLPWPPPEPEPKPGEDALFEDVDWLTFSHDQLYDMVHNGVDVAGATAIAAKWAKLGDALREIGDELARALTASFEAWEGDAADQARNGIAALAQWSQDAGGTAIDVADCVSTEAINADAARRSMPEPVAGPKVPIPIPAVSGTSPMSAAFSSAPDIVRDPHGPTQQQREAHQEAARVMQQFQNSSREVYGTVPQFSPPFAQNLIVDDPKPPLPQPPPNPPQPPPPPPPLPPVPPPGPGPGAGPGPAGPVAGDERPVTRTGSPVAGQPAAELKPGPVTPAPATPANPAAPAAAAAPGQAPARGAAPAGAGAPMMGGMAGGAGQGEDQERKSPKYLEGDPSIWRIADRLAPKVIGEDEDGA